jgi:hypothetical protein
MRPRADTDTLGAGGDSAKDIAEAEKKLEERSTISSS